MAFPLPTFNLTCNIQSYPGGVTRVTSPCNLAFGRRVNVASTGGTGSTGIMVVCMTLLLPALTDCRTPTPGALPDSTPTVVDQVEVPAGSGRKYWVVFCDDIGKGFANEHRVAILQQLSIPVPMP